MSEELDGQYSRGLRCALGFVPHDADWVPPFWQPYIVGWIHLIGQSLGPDASAIEILHHATMPMEKYAAWVETLPTDDSRHRILREMAAPTETGENIRSALRRSVCAWESQFLSDEENRIWSKHSPDQKKLFPIRHP